MTEASMEKRYRIRERQVVSCPKLGRMVGVFPNGLIDGPNDALCTRCQNYKGKTCHYLKCSFVIPAKAGK